MTKQQDKLFSPFVLNGHVLKNRIGIAPMTRMSSPGGSIPRQDVLDFLVRRAQNGVSLIYTEAIITDNESAQGYPGQARLLTQNQMETGDGSDTRGRVSIHRADLSLRTHVLAGGESRPSRDCAERHRTQTK